MVKKFTMRLEQWIRAKCLTNAQFGEIIGVSSVAVSRYRKGNRFPRPIVMKKIAMATKGRVGPDDFYDTKVKP